MISKLTPYIIYASLRIYRHSTKLSHNIKWKKKIKKLNTTKGKVKLTDVQIHEIRKFYEQYKLKNIPTYWHRFYCNCNGVFSKKYIPEILFYTQLEPMLNNIDFTSALADKNLLDKLFSTIKQPEIIVKNSNGFFIIMIAL